MMDDMVNTLTSTLSVFNTGVSCTRRSKYFIFNMQCSHSVVALQVKDEVIICRTL